MGVAEEQHNFSIQLLQSFHYHKMISPAISCSNDLGVIGGIISTTDLHHLDLRMNNNPAQSVVLGLEH